MVGSFSLEACSASRRAVAQGYLRDEGEAVEALLERARWPEGVAERVEGLARELVVAVRERPLRGRLEAFLRQYDLSSQEGVMLMCLAEALLRIPDDATADALIRDKLSQAQWESHLGHGGSFFANASTWGLVLTGRLVRLSPEQAREAPSFLRRLVARSGEPVVRMAVRQAMRLIGQQFILGETIEEALEQGEEAARRGYLHSFDMLGEAALTAADAERYFENYARAIAALASRKREEALMAGPGVSIKLSALHPRYHFAQRARVLEELPPRLLDLARRARDAGIHLTIDAEEAERLDLGLDLFERLYRDPALEGWSGLGIAVQAYQKRALVLIEWLTGLAREVGRPIPVRLVKGAYLDTEIKRAQERGLRGYPVFTRKAATDVSYLACARALLEAGPLLYPQFATHNAHTVAAIACLAGERRDFEFQRLHGMGESLYAIAFEERGIVPRCRIYAPVGSHRELLPYLVRRLLENGANSSFVHRILDERVAVEEIIADPVREMAILREKPHPDIPLPRDLFLPERINSAGVNLADPLELAPLARALEEAAAGDREGGPIVDGELLRCGAAREIHSPADPARRIGRSWSADSETMERALESASGAAHDWNATAPGERAEILRKVADLLEEHRAELAWLAIAEGGRTLADALSEVREAVDFCRYYAHRAERDFTPMPLPGISGEHNELHLEGRGPFVCISPWNFPLAIFTGQIAAALAAGNSVVAKPASLTPLCATRLARLFHEGGVPPQVLHLLPGAGEEIGMALVEDRRVAGVAFTGSTEVARKIHLALARRNDFIPFIAETGGLNAMIADSSALPEQVVADVLTSAFNSAGQRCSALRVLFVQEELAPRLIELLRGAMAELVVGDPARLESDLGPLISASARAALERHLAFLERHGRAIARTPLPGACERGHFFPPCAYEIERIGQLPGEVFGPVLHLVRYRAEALDRVLEEIDATGYGLTLGIHSRIDATVRHISRRLRVGNAYVNRNMIGAVVGTQPFGGEGLSGTGPKAGGPFYLHRFATERVLTVNTAAIGGDAALLTLGDETAIRAPE